MRILPVFTPTTYCSYEIDLDGRDWTLVFKWNNRANAWYLRIENDRGRVVAQGIRLVVGVDLLRLFPGDLPPGLLAVISLRPVQTDPVFESFSRSHRLVYFEASDIEKVPDDEVKIYDPI